MRPEYRDRAASLSDLAAVVELLRAHELADHGRVTADWNEIVRFVWRDPGFRIQDDGRILERRGVPIAFAGVFREDDAGAEIGHVWRSRWDSLRLLTPNWATRLPGWSYQGTEPDGYMSSAEFSSYLASYAASFGAPVHGGLSGASSRARATCARASFQSCADAASRAASTRRSRAEERTSSARATSRGRPGARMSA